MMATVVMNTIIMFCLKRVFAFYCSFSVIIFFVFVFSSIFVFFFDYSLLSLRCSAVVWWLVAAVYIEWWELCPGEPQLDSEWATQYWEYTPQLGSI